MSINKKPLDTTVKVKDCSKKPELNGKTGKVVAYFNNKVFLYGVSFDTFLNGHGLSMATEMPEHLLIHIGRRNCWWLEEDELY